MSSLVSGADRISFRKMSLKPKPQEWPFKLQNWASWLLGLQDSELKGFGPLRFEKLKGIWISRQKIKEMPSVKILPHSLSVRL